MSSIVEMGQKSNGGDRLGLPYIITYPIIVIIVVNNMVPT